MKFILNFRLHLTTKYSVKKKKKYPEFCFLLTYPWVTVITGSLALFIMIRWNSNYMIRRVNNLKIRGLSLSIYVCLNVSSWLQALHTPLFGQLLLLAVIIGVGGWEWSWQMQYWCKLLLLSSTCTLSSRDSFFIIPEVSQKS